MLENVQGRSPNLLKIMEQKRLEKYMSPREAYEKAWGKPLEYDPKDYTLCFNRLHPVYQQAVKRGFAKLAPDSFGNQTLTINDAANVNSLFGQLEQRERIRTAQAKSLDSWGNILEQEMG
jgi:hypothetical protein